MLVGAVAALVSQPASADPLGGTQTAYWWQPEPVTGLIPVPGVPSGGLYVASSPSGPQAISALRIANGFGAGVVRLTMHVAQRQVVNPPAITVYPVTSSWQAGGPQVWSSRPAYDGGAHIAQGVFDAAQSTMTIALPARALSSGIALVPSITPGATISATFAISFSAPTSGDLRLIQRASPHPTHSTTPSQRPSRTPSQTPSASQSATHRPHHHDGSPRPTASAPHHHSHTPSSPPTEPAPSTSSRPTVSPSSDGGGHGLLIALIVAAAVAAAAGGAAVVRRRGRSSDEG